LVIGLAATVVIAEKVRIRLSKSSKAQMTAAKPLLERSEAERRLAEIEVFEAADPSSAVGRYESLLPELTEAAGLADLHDRARAQLDRTRGHWAKTDLAAARASATTDPARSVDLCERATRTAAELPPGAGSQYHADARAIAGEIASRVGVILEPVRGQFRLGSTPAYSAELHPLMRESLRQQGFVTIADSSPFHPLWEELAPYRLMLSIVEEQSEFYQQSKNRITELRATLSFKQADSVLWSVRLNARTEVPLPNLRAYEASRLAFAPEQSLTIEQRFYQNALASLRDKLILNLRVPRAGG
jgi:hypothetical protein